MNRYDLIVVGAGPGGYVAAIRAAQLGMKPAIIEREHLGGICLNWGCIPTKALLRSAEVTELVRHASSFGVKAEAGVPDLRAMVQRSREVSAKLTGGIGFLLAKHSIDIIWGEAKAIAPGKVEVATPSHAPVQPQNSPPRKVLGNGTYAAKNIIVATGARPRVLPGLEPDHERIWTYFDALNPKTQPKSLLIVGSGAIGMEFASFYARLGSEVTVIEAMPRILPAEDEEVAAMARKRLEKTGIRFLVDARVSGAKATAKDVSLSLVDANGKPQTLTADVVMSAVGVVGNTEGLGLEQSGVTLENGIIATDKDGRSSVEGIWAIGDVAGAPMLAHKASHDGVRAVEAMAGQTTHAPAASDIPRCTYCDPQIASIGLTEAQARDLGRPVRVGRFPFAANGKAIALGESDGLVKVIFDDRTGQLIGAHMTGPEVTELLAAFSVGMSAEATDEALARTVFAHPTLSESLHEAALSAFGRALHIA